jgi:putative transport protein
LRGPRETGGFTADQVMTNVTTAYAITYIFGLVGLILIIRFLPRMLGVNLRSEAAKLEASHRGGVEDRVHALNDIVVRAYRVENEKLVGVPLGAAYERLPGRISIEKLRRGGELIPVTEETTVELGDEICIVGFLDEFVAAAGRIGPELSDPDLLDVHIESCRIVVLRTKVKKVTASLDQIVARQGCFVSRIQRLGVDIPLEGEIDVQAGDVLHVTGPVSVWRRSARLWAISSVRPNRPILLPSRSVLSSDCWSVRGPSQWPGSRWGLERPGDYWPPVS